jgi:hypothetical protein
MRLVNEDGKEVKVGDTVIREGKPFVVEYVETPRHAASEGKMMVKGDFRLLYVSCFGLKFIDRTDRRRSIITP